MYKVTMQYFFMHVTLYGFLCPQSCVPLVNSAVGHMHLLLLIHALIYQVDNACGEDFRVIIQLACSQRSAGRATTGVGTNVERFHSNDGEMKLFKVLLKRTFADKRSTIQSQIATPSTRFKTVD
mgnify:CR=1 FL=1